MESAARTNGDGFRHADPVAHQRILGYAAHIAVTCAEALKLRDGKQHRTFCALHELDGEAHTESCDIRVNARGKVYAVCRSHGCDGDEIVKALRRRGMIPKRKVVREYVYDDEQGDELFLHLRYDPKDFGFERNGSRAAGCMTGARYVLYALRSILATPAGSCWIGFPEGERDAETLWALDLHATCDARGANNIKADVMGPLKGHRIAVFPDADDAGKKHGRLVAKLALEADAAEVRIVSMPARCKDVTEFVERGGTREQLDAVIEAAPAVTLADLADVEVSDGALYKATSEGFVLGDSGAPISNYTAYIVREIERNDGSGTLVKEYLVELTLKGVGHRHSVPQEGFDTLNWVSKYFAAGASHGAGPGCKDHVRNAIRTLSLARGIEAKELRSHTGWIKLDGANVYLTGGGAIAATQEIDVALPAKLSKYSLPLHVSPEDQIDGVRASLKILDADAQRHHGYGLLSLIYRSVLGSCNGSGHLTGDTGALKSTRLELMMRHFGAGFAAGPGGGFFSWSGTANSIEVETFATKDCLTPIDEFCPPSTSTLEKLKQDDAASRLFRAQADGTGRSRLTPGIELRAERAPRGLIVSTGESIPGSHAKGDPASLRARILVIKIRKSDARKELMARCTVDGALGKYANAMSGYIAWLASRLDQIQATMAGEQFIMLRAKVANALPVDCHERTASMIADLYLSFTFFLKYALEIGALSQSEHDAHVEDMWKSLLLLAAEQGQQGHSPTERFLQLVRTAISTERAYLDELELVTRPEGMAAPWGSGSSSLRPLTCKLIGWFKGDDIFLEPDVAYKVVSEVSPLPVDIETLKARLKEEGKLASCDAGRNRNTVRRLVTKGKPRVSVLHLKSATLTGE